MMQTVKLNTATVPVAPYSLLNFEFCVTFSWPSKFFYVPFSVESNFIYHFLPVVLFQSVLEMSAATRRMSFLEADHKRAKIVFVAFNKVYIWTENEHKGVCCDWRFPGRN